MLQVRVEKREAARARRSDSQKSLPPPPQPTSHPCPLHPSILSLPAPHAPSLHQAPIDALPPSIGLAYAPPYIPPPGPPRPASPRPLTSTEAAATAADAAWRPARRRAVLVACGYGQEEDVATGPVVDAGAVRTLLATKFNFQPGETVFLSDAQPHARLLPTKANILAAARWLVAGAGPADSLVFAFFGRGAGADGAPVGWVRRGGEEGGVPQPQPRPAAPPGGAGGGSDSDGDGGGGGSADENAPPSPSSVEAVTATSSPVKGAPAAASVAGAAGEGAAASASAATSAAAAVSLAAFFGATAAAAHAPPSPSRHSTRASVPSSPAHSTATPRPAPGLASPAAPGARRGVPPAPTATSTTSQASATFLPAPPPAPVAASGTPGAGFCAALATSDWAAGKGLAPSDLHAALVAPLPPGARLLACIDAAGGRFSLGLPAAAAVRPDGWPAWEAAGSRAVGAGAPGAGEAVLIAGDTPAPPPLVVAPPPSSSPSLTPPQPAHAQPASGALAFALVQAVEQGHTGSWAALVRALRYAVRNGGPAFGGGGGGGGHGGGAGGGFGGPAALAPPGAARPPAVTASRRFDFNRPFLL